jgi:hypothetical protein
MFGPPALMPDAIADLVAGIGGPSAAAGMLCIPSAELARWLEAGDAPQIALGLFCYAGPDGRVAAQLDLETSSAQPPRSAMPSFRKLSVDAPL